MFRSSRDYRNYLVQNADDIIRYNGIAHSYQCSSYISKKLDNPVNQVMRTLNVPYYYNDVSDKTTPVGYETNPVKNDFLNKIENDSTYIAD